MAEHDIYEFEKEKRPGFEKEHEERERREEEGQKPAMGTAPTPSGTVAPGEGRPMERRGGARGTAAMDRETRREVARKGGLAVSRNKQHMAEIGRKGGQSVSKNREHMAKIGRKGGAASRGQRGGGTSGTA